MSRLLPISLIARDWYRPAKAERGTMPVPRVVERLRAMLIWDERRRARGVEGGAAAVRLRDV
jgi:hypothetical protein